MEGDICSRSGFHSMISSLYQYDKFSTIVEMRQSSA